MSSSLKSTETLPTEGRERAPSAFFNRDRVLAILPGAILLVIVILLSIFTPNFMTVRNVINVFEQTSALALMAVGMTAVLVGGGIDLSLSWAPCSCVAEAIRCWLGSS
jgi:ribose transport system permease protein